MLTLSNIRSLRNELETIQNLCDDILKYRERERMFKNEEELSEASILSKSCPDEFFKFRLFVYYIELCRDKKGYYIYTENYVPTSKELRSLCSVECGSQYRICKDDFEQAKKYFELFSVDMIHKYYKDEEQLIYMY